MSNDFQKWLGEAAKGKGMSPLSAGDVVSSSPGEPFGTIEFLKFHRKHYVAEVGKKGDVYIYHFFFPATGVPKDFEDKMGDAFLDVFKSPEKVEACFSDELKSWAVRVSGFAHNVWGDDMAIRVFSILDHLLEQ